MTTAEFPMPADGGHRLITHASRGLASAAARIHQTAGDALDRPRNLRLATGHLLGQLRSLRGDAIGVRLAFTESEDGGLRDDQLAAQARHLEQYLDALIVEADRVDQAAQQPGGDQDAGVRAGLVELADQALTLKLWLGAASA